MMKRFLLFVACILTQCAICDRLMAQTMIPTYIPNVVPPSPNASTLTKFSDVPISPYTGTADITIPIYNIHVKGMDIPVNVAYHTGGIRLAEESGVVGLGWALNAGGAISRTINDKDDLLGTYTTDVPQPMGDLSVTQPANGGFGAYDAHCSYCPPINVNKYIFNFNCSYNIYFINPYTLADTPNDFTQAFQHSSSTPYDLEPDSYSYNFLGKSGKFIVTRSHVIVKEKQDNVRIQMINTTGTVYHFAITDEDGNQYFFNDTESGGLASAPNSITTWLLSTIITKNQDVINFSYAINASQHYNHVASTNTQTYYPYCPAAGQLLTQSNTGYMYENTNLQSIDYTDGQVQFTYDADRTDLDGGVKLNKIALYSKTTAGLQYLKEDDFSYSYFNPNTNLELERLRLDAITEVSGTTALTPYSFTYNSAAPVGTGEKHGFSVDHWGYYNGAGNTQLIPSQITSYQRASETLYLNYSGANRDPSPTYMQYFSLQKITYPTGGYSTINYAANTYDVNNSQIPGQQPENPYLTVSEIDYLKNLQSTDFTSGDPSGTFDFSKIYPVLPDGSTATNAVLNVAFISTHSDGWPSTYLNTPGNLSFTFNGSTTDLTESDLMTGGPARSKSINLSIHSATTLPWSAHYNSGAIPPSEFSEIHVTVTFQGYTPYVNNNPTLTGGGLCVTAITDYNSDGTIVKKRTWDYGYSGGTLSYGKLMAQPSYAHTELIGTSGGDQCASFMLFANSNSALTSSIGGNIVGYSQVTEYTVNPANNADNGKTEYYYVNVPDTTINYGGFRKPGMANLGNNLNGSLLTKINYANAGGTYKKVNQTDNFYHTANRMVYYSAKFQPSVFFNSVGVCYTGPPVENSGIAEFFPSIKSERVLLDSTRTITYDQNDNTKFVPVSNKNFYDNPVHYLVTRTKFTDSKGNTHISKMTYPQDYIPTGATTTGNTVLDALIAQNRLAENIEKYDTLLYLNSTTPYVTSATETRFKQLASLAIVHDKVYRLDLTAPVTDFVPMSISGNTYTHDSRYRQLISFDTYDAANNISQYTVANQLPVSILWDYRGVSPVAQAKAAALADVAYTSFDADANGNWTFDPTARDSVTKACTGTKSYLISAAAGLSATGLTPATTYVVSYWTKNSTPFTIAGTISGYPIAGATLSGWTYYEYKVTGQSTISITGAGNIDEVRLYPQNAEMTSYTYNPQIGVSSINDARAGINYYEYDKFQRLMNIKDQYGNIVKHFDYHYQGQ